MTRITINPPAGRDYCVLDITEYTGKPLILDIAAMDSLISQLVRCRSMLINEETEEHSRVRKSSEEDKN